jgi:hypothetical protein
MSQKEVKVYSLRKPKNEIYYVEIIVQSIFEESSTVSGILCHNSSKM